VDFAHARDEFQLLRSAFAGFGRWSDSKFFASTSGQAHDETDRILYETDTGKLFYDADGNWAQGVARIQIAVLQNLAHLDWTDFAMS
jgi:Ca2+-binding RTX toxin-like protein